MRKQLGIITSLILLCATALCWAGCSRYDNCYDDCYVEPVCPEPCRPVCKPVCKPVCPEPCKPVCPEPCRPRPVCPEPCKPVCKPICPPACPPEPCKPVCKPVCPPPEPRPPVCCAEPIRCKYPQNGEIECDGVILRATQPKLCILGDNYALDLEVTACIDVCEVTIHAMLPEGTSVVRSQPEGIRPEGNKAVWKIQGMSQGETKKARILLRADREGDLCVCFCVQAVPVRFCSILCAKPILSCEKCGPEEVCPGDPVHYNISVTNHGSCAAEEVVVIDNVPDGLEHSSGLRTLTFKLGTLQPCETKKINVCFTAVKRGTVCNTILVTACNANQTSCQWCTKICKECVELVKTGPKEVMIGKTAEYLITVSNPGDKSLTDVVVTDVAPTVTSIVEAKGAQVAGNQAVWRLRELKPGEKQSFTIVLTTCTPGYYCNRVSVTDCQGCTANAEACTRWKGRPSLNMCCDGCESPICIGEPNFYTIRVTNSGSEEDTNILFVAEFPPEIQPTGASGPTPGSIAGQTVTFAPYPNIGPRQVLEYRIEAKAVQSGDARVKFRVSSDSIKTPISEEESTIVN